MDLWVVQPRIILFDTAFSQPCDPVILNYRILQPLSKSATKRLCGGLCPSDVIGATPTL